MCCRLPRAGPASLLRSPRSRRKHASYAEQWRWRPGWGWGWGWGWGRGWGCLSSGSALNEERRTGPGAERRGLPTAHGSARRMRRKPRNATLAGKKTPTPVLKTSATGEPSPHTCCQPRSPVLSMNYLQLTHPRRRKIRRRSPAPSRALQLCKITDNCDMLYSPELSIFLPGSSGAGNIVCEMFMTRQKSTFQVCI